MESPTDRPGDRKPTSKYQVKAMFARRFEEHKAALFLKNYSEKMIDSWAENGIYMKQLFAAFKQAYTTDPEVYRIDRFQLEMTGFFSVKRKDGSKPKDKVKFEFSYAYDHSNNELRLTSLKGIMNDDLEKTYPIVGHPSRELPPAGRVYQELFAIREKQILANIQSDKQAKSKQRQFKRR
jgi:hypothetical protein